MLPPFIIEQIRRREERSRQEHDEQPRLEIPAAPPAPRPAQAPEENAERGVVIIEL
jgi:hypothetical protein